MTMINGYTRTCGLIGNPVEHTMSPVIHNTLAEAIGEKPILLLDDLFDKLDMGRVEKLLTLVGGEDFGQILITDCNKVRLESTLERAGKEYALFMVEGGDVKR